MKKNITQFFINKKYIFFCFIFLLLNIFLINKASKYYDLKIFSPIYFIIIVGLIIVELFLLFFINKKIKENYPIEKIFLIIAIPIGLLFMLFLPLGQIPDEKAHFARSYAISEGYLISKVSKDNWGYAPIPLKVVQTIVDQEDDELEANYDNISKDFSEEITDIPFTNTSLYNFIVYTPQVVGIMIGKILHLPIAIIAYLARLFNFAAYILLLYFSIKFLPFLKEYALFIAMLPISIQEGVSLAPDALAISLSCFLISYVLKLKYGNQEKIKNKDLVILSVSSIICCLCKIVYFPIVLFVFILPFDKFKSKKDKYIKLFILLITCLIINGLWTMYATRYLAETNPGVNSTEQMKYVLTNPFSYLVTLFRTIKNNMFEYGFELCGRRLSLLDVDVGRLYPTLAFLVLIYLTIKNRVRENFISKRIIYLSLLIIILVVGLIFTSLYIQWTPLKNKVIEGPQGRYFIPILMLVPIIFMRSKEKNDKMKIDFDDKKYLLSFIVFQCTNALAFIIMSGL